MADETELAEVYRDRIKELRRVPASSLLPNPGNWRRHSQEQLDGIRAVFEAIGIAGAEMVFETADGELMLFDGHARKDVAGEQLIPVLVTDLTPEEADQILSTFDPLGMMANTDHDALRALMETIETSTDGVEQLLADVSAMFDLDSFEAMQTTDGEPNDPAEQWEGMPEYQHNDLTPYHTVHVHFTCDEDIAAFAELMGQRCDSGTKYLWHPRQEHEKHAENQYENTEVAESADVPDLHHQQGQGGNEDDSQSPTEDGDAVQDSD